MADLDEDFDPQSVNDETLDFQRDGNKVIIALKDVQAEWNELGNALNVLQSTMNGINRMHAPAGNYFQHLSAVISAWLRRERREVRPSWRKLCEALVVIGQQSVAIRIAKDHSIDTGSKKQGVAQRQQLATEGNPKNTGVISDVSRKNLTVDEIDGRDDNVKHENGHAGHAEQKYVSGQQQQQRDLVCTDETFDDDSIPSRTISQNLENQEKGYAKRNVSKGDGGEYLAVTITNTYKNTQKPLKGVKHDYDELCKTFDMPSIDHIRGKDVLYDELNEILDETEDAIQKAQQPYKIAFVVFSGHGGITQEGTPFIVTEDRQAGRQLKRVDLNKLIDCFLEIIGDQVPIIFIIDACRSVPRGATKGDGEPGYNYLVGYATKEGKKAYCDPDKGSYWIQAIAKGLRCAQDPEPVVKVLKRARQQVINQTGSQYPHIDDEKLKDKGIIFDLVYQPDTEEEEIDTGETVVAHKPPKDPPEVEAKGVGGSSHFMNSYWYIAIAVIVCIAGVVILIMVSRNPDNKIVPQPTEKELLNILQGLTTNLENLCVHLLDMKTCNNIFKDHTTTFDSRRLRLIEFWGKKKSRTWSDLVTALDDIGECTLALDIAGQHGLKHKCKK